MDEPGSTKNPEDYPLGDYPDLDSVMWRAVVNGYEVPAEYLPHRLDRTPDHQLVEFLGACTDIEDTVAELMYQRHEDYLLTSPIDPETEKAVWTSEQRDEVRIPVADRSTIHDFLKNTVVRECLEEYCQHQEISVDDEDDWPTEADIEGKIAPDDSGQIVEASGSINDLPANFAPMDEAMFFALIGAYFWSPDRPEPYGSLEATLVDIVKDAPNDWLIPLLLRIQEDYIRRESVLNEEDSYRPIFRKYAGHGPYFEEGGVVWRRFALKVLRYDLENYVRTDFNYEGFGPDQSERLYSGFTGVLHQLIVGNSRAESKINEFHTAIDQLEAEVNKR